MKRKLAVIVLVFAMLAAMPAVGASSDPKAAVLAAGGAFSTAIDADGKLWAWGDNHAGQFGNGTRDDSYTPVNVIEHLSFISVSTGYDHTLAVDSGGGLWIFGDNKYGQLGNDEFGEGLYSSTPERRVPGETFARVAAGGYHSIAIDTNGGLWTWGLNGFGQIGDGTVGNRMLTPYKIPTQTRFVSAAAGNAHSLAIDEDGGLWVWGDNFMGQLGIGSNGGWRTVPIRIMEDTRFVSVAAGCFHSMAIDEDGGLWAWGWDSHFQIGGGVADEDRFVILPSKILEGTRFVSVSGGSYHTLAVDSRGNLWTWGSNVAGQLGDERKDPSTGVPTIIKRGMPFASVSAGAWFSLAIDYFGGVWAWGNNGYGQLGDGTDERRFEPVRVWEHPILGDIDDDHSIDAADITLLRRYIAAEDKDAFLLKNPKFNPDNADMNGDGTICAADVAWLRLWVSGFRRAEPPEPTQ